MASVDIQAVLERLQRVQLSSPSINDDSLSDEALAWLLLAPMWPLSIAVRGFPSRQGGLVTGEEVQAVLEHAAARGTLEVTQGEPPWDGTWYGIPRLQAMAAMEKLLARTDNTAAFMAWQLAAIGYQLANLSERLPPPLEKFTKLANAGPIGKVARHLDTMVSSEIANARRRGAVVAPEANRWIEVAEPLGRMFGGELEVAVARAVRRVELFERRSRDEYFSRNYTRRAELEQAFDELLDDDGDAWALHLLGDGGMGKTMFVRQIASRHANERGLVTSRIDFDHINPDYPVKAPGLLLMALAEDLRLAESDAVQSLLVKFDEVVGAAHRGVDDGSAVSAATVGGYIEQAERVFSIVLEEIARERIPLLILDTCEELARIRPDGKLPDAVIKTFELLERLHAAVPRLRVVFSGRRHLASRGSGWGIENSALPARPYLRRVLVQGFDAEEAKAFLREYRQDERDVGDEYWDKILELSQLSSDAERQSRYNPYDLNLYASWVTSRDTHDPHALLSAGAHQYVKERIVGRVSPLVAPWVPILAQLRNFDRELLAEIAEHDSTLSHDLLEEIIAQEWVDVGRGMQWAASSDGKVPETWTIDQNLAERLARYYKSDSPQAWFSASARLRAVLPDLTINRPWSMLMPSYLQLAFELLREDANATLAWWAKIDDKIVSGGEWRWAQLVTERLLVNQSGGEWDAAGDICLAAVQATDAAIRVKLGSEGSLIQSAWSNVLRLLGDAPGTHAERLRYRAHAGVVSSVRWFAVPLHETYVFELLDAVKRIPPPPGLARNSNGALEGDDDAEKAFDMELVATEIGWIENAIETLEQIDWQNRPPPGEFLLTLRVRISIALGQLRLREVPESLITYLQCLSMRLFPPPLDGTSRLLHSPYPVLQLKTLPQERPREGFMDWSWPEEPLARALLESARSVRFVGDAATCRSLRAEIDELPLNSLDGERARAALLLLLSDAELPEEPDWEWIERSIEINNESAPQCCAHSWTPPYFQVAIEALADRGKLQDAVELCESIVHQRRYHIRVRQAAERALLAIAIKWRLFEVGVGRQTSLNDSERAADVLLAQQAKVFDSLERGSLPQRMPYLATAEERDSTPPPHLSAIQTRWPLGHYTESSERTMLVSQLSEVARDGKSSVRRADRFAANLALREASIEMFYDRDMAERLLSWSARIFTTAGDHIGQVLARAVAAMLYAAAGDRKRLMESLELADQAYSAATLQGLAPPAESLRVLARGTWSDREVLSSADSMWFPVRARLAFCHSIAEKLGSGSKNFSPWELAARFGDKRPADVELVARDLDGSSQERVLLAPDANSTSPGVATANDSDAMAADKVGKWSEFGREFIAHVISAGLVVTIMAMVAAFVAFYIRGDSWLTGFILDRRTWLNELAVQTVIGVVLASLAYKALPALVHAYVAIAERTFRLVVSFAPLRESTHQLTEPAQFKYASQILMVGTRLTSKANWSPVQTYEESSEERGEDYVTRARAWGKREGFRYRLALDWLQVAINTDLVIPTSMAAHPWEALFALRHSSEQRRRQRSYRFRRTLPGRDSMRDPFTGIESHIGIRGPLGIWIAQRSHQNVHLWRDCWKRAAQQRKYFQIETPESGDEAYGTAIRPGAAFLHVIDEMVETDQGLALRLGPRTQMFASGVARRFPELRFAILQIPPRQARRRFVTDRLEVARARVLAAQLYEAGVPAVIVIPSLPAEVCSEVLAPIVDVVASRGANSTVPLMYAMRRAQDVIRARLPDLPIDVAFDLCLYCVNDLNLSIVPGAK